MKAMAGLMKFVALRARERREYAVIQMNFSEMFAWLTGPRDEHTDGHQMAAKTRDFAVCAAQSKQLNPKFNFPLSRMMCFRWRSDNWLAVRVWS